jgi:hypothetical protein
MIEEERVAGVSDEEIELIVNNTDQMIRLRGNVQCDPMHGLASA